MFCVKSSFFVEIVVLLLDIYFSMKTDKLKYAFAFIFLLCAFLCGVNFKQWYATNRSLERHISLIYSFGPGDKGYGSFEQLLQQEFRKQGIEPVFDKFYLDCNNLSTKEEVESIKVYLEILKNKQPDLILSVGDQSTFALLSPRHQLLSSVPVVACNVHFPDEKLIGEYERSNVYVLRDTPDFKRNMDFIAALQPNVKMEVIYNVDFTTLGHKSFDLLTGIVDRKNVQVLAYESAFSVQNEYKKLQEMIEYYNLMPAMARHRFKQDKLTVSLCPFRYIKGTSLLVMMERSRTDQGKQVFLLDKFDLMALPIVKAMNIPSFSCIREGFGEGVKVVGGYMATDEISARSAAEFSVRLMNKEDVGTSRIRDLEKEYVLDWTYFSAYDSYHVKNVPKGVHIINYPLYDHYREELYLLFGLFILTFVVVLISLLRMRKRSRAERENMEMLEEAHKRLTLSTDGGRISLWNIQGDYIEFDENYTRMVGLEQRKFVRTDFLKYTHPDDVPLLDALYETLHLSSDMYVQRVRFCLDEKEEDYRWYELRCRSLKDAKGKFMLAGVMQDIQEQVDRENQLILAKQIAEKAELKQSFLNNMSHEIRTPLNAIVGFTNLLLGEGADEIEPEEKEAMLEIINRNNELLLKLIDDVVEISRLDSGHMDFDVRVWDMTKIVKDIYTAYQSLVHPSLQFRLELDETVSLLVSTDRLRFIQVISNFLSNASKFTRSGWVTLGGEMDRVKNEVCVYVEDTGKGMDGKELMMIFDRFYKTDEFEQGSGLGLSICKVIIERLHGRIEVKSEAGKGSRFAVVFPLVEAV